MAYRAPASNVLGAEEVRNFLHHNTRFSIKSSRSSVAQPPRLCGLTKTTQSGWRSCSLSRLAGATHCTRLATDGDWMHYDRANPLQGGHLSRILRTAPLQQAVVILLHDSLTYTSPRHAWLSSDQGRMLQMTSEKSALSPAFKPFGEVLQAASARGGSG